MEINIIGMGKGKKLAPITGIRWGLTRVIHEMPVDVLFDIHCEETLSQGDRKLFFKRLEACEETGTIFYSTNEHEPKVSMRYPIEKIIKKFRSAFFTDSSCYAIAMAIFKGAKVINLYGVNQAKKNISEYHHNKPGTDYWVGFARGRGITVNIHGRISEVCKTYDRKVYGYGIPQAVMESEHVGNI